MKNTDNKPMDRLTVTIPGELLNDVQRHRSELMEGTGLKVSTSAVISALVRTALEAKRAAPSHH